MKHWEDVPVVDWGYYVRLIYIPYLGGMNLSNNEFLSDQPAISSKTFKII